MPTSVPRSPDGRRHGLGTKNLLGLPWRVALALQDDGWIIRNAIVWHKPNAMPESVSRPAQLPLRTDLPARQVPALLVRPRPDPRTARHEPGQPGTARASRRHSAARVQRPATRTASRPPQSTARIPGKSSAPAGSARTAARRRHPNGRNPGDMWSIPTRPYRGPALRRVPARVPDADASRPDASRAAWSSIRSAASARPALPRSPSVAGSPA